MPPKSLLEITSTAIDTRGADNAAQTGWVEFSDGKCYHYQRATSGEAPFLLATRSRPYEGAPWKYRYFKSPVRVALLVAELDG